MNMIYEFLENKIMGKDADISGFPTGFLGR